MRVVGTIVRTLFLFSLLLGLGCDSLPVATDLLSRTDKNIYVRYAPVAIDIMPLTEFVVSENEREQSHIKLYVSMLDTFGCQIKTPGTFRFELYEYIQRTAEPKGRRVLIWPDVVLLDIAKNNDYWQDFLRAYEFKLDFEPEEGKSYVLQVTCLCPNGKRLSSEFIIK